MAPARIPFIGHLPAHQLTKGPRQRETGTGGTRRAAIGCQIQVTLEDVSSYLGGEAGPVVGDSEPDCAILSRRPDRDPTPSVPLCVADKDVEE